MGDVKSQDKFIYDDRHHSILEIISKLEDTNEIEDNHNIFTPDPMVDSKAHHNVTKFADDIKLNIVENILLAEMEDFLSHGNGTSEVTVTSSEINPVAQIPSRNHTSTGELNEQN